MNFLKFGLISLIASTSLFRGMYTVDKSHSTVGFSVKHLMISNVHGNFNDFSGNFEYDENKKILTGLNGEIIVKSINTFNEDRDNHLKNNDFFNAEKYPNITFKLNKIVKDKAYGSLTMKGVTKDVVLNYNNSGVVKDLYGKQRVGITLNGDVNRQDYGISFNKTLDNGGVAVGDKVNLTIELKGVLNN